MKKATSDLTIIITLVAAIMIVFMLISIFVNRGIPLAKSYDTSYFSMRADTALQGIKQSFEKTSLFFGMMNAAKELGAHGGVSNPEAITGETPVMETANNVAFLAPIKCTGSECRIRKRMPFVFYEDMNANINTGELQYLIVPTLEGTDKNFEENFRDVAAGKYAFNVLVQAFMLVPGTVTFKICQADRCTAPQQITESGAKIVRVGAEIVQNNERDLVLFVSGSRGNVAVLRTVAVSIYDKDVVQSPNELLAKNLNDYRGKLKAQVSGYTLNPYEAVFAPAGRGIYGTLDARDRFLRGIAWAPNKISVESSDTSIYSLGTAEEEAKIRYWKMYWFAEYFVDIVDLNGIVMPRLLNSVDTRLSSDYCLQTFSDCGRDPGCPQDCTSLYSGREFLNALNSGLQDLVDKLNNLCGGTGFSWKISIPESTFSDMYFASTPYMKEDKSIVPAGCSLPCNCRDEGDPPTNVCDSCPATSYSCTREYSRRFDSDANNLKILVEITDKKYTIFDSAEQAWVNPTFKFFVEFYPVDDNYCNGYACDSIPTGHRFASLPAPGNLPTPPEDFNGDGLFECKHTRNNCADIGGERVNDGDNVFCRVSGASCPAGWTQYQQYTTTQNNRCCGECWDYGVECYDSKYHAWSNTNTIEEYYGVYYMCGYPTGCCLYTCYATRTQIGCY